MEKPSLDVQNVLHKKKKWFILRGFHVKDPKWLFYGIRKTPLQPLVLSVYDMFLEFDISTADHLVLTAPKHEAMRPLSNQSQRFCLTFSCMAARRSRTSPVMIGVWCGQF